MGESRYNNDLITLTVQEEYSQAVYKMHVLTIYFNSYYQTSHSGGQYDQTFVLTSWHIACKIEATRLHYCVLECNT